MNYGWTLYRKQESRPSPRKRNAKKAKWLSEEGLQIAVRRRLLFFSQRQKAKEKRKAILI